MRLRAQITGATASRWAARFAPDRVKKAKRCALRLFAPKAVREESFGRPRAFLRKLHEARRSWAAARQFSNAQARWQPAMGAYAHWGFQCAYARHRASAKPTAIGALRAVTTRKARGRPKPFVLT